MNSTEPVSHTNSLSHSPETFQFQSFGHNHVKKGKRNWGHRTYLENIVASKPCCFLNITSF